MSTQPENLLQASNRLLSFEELSQATQLNATLLIEIIECSLVAPLSGAAPPEWQFDLAAVNRLNQAARLWRDLHIEWADIGLILNLCDEIERLKHENQQLKRQLRRFVS